jgi:L-tryptophan--pyruvate aminotransferase
MTALDLSMGHPLYLEEYWSNLSVNYDEGNIHIQAYANMAYGLHEGNVNLKEAIIDIHDSVGNAETKGRHVLIGNGATQVLHAVLTQSPYPEVYARPPYFFRFPKIFEQTGHLEIHAPKQTPHFAELLTLPSNPDFVRYPETNSHFKVHDLCYNWPQYGPVVKHDNEIMVFSLGKATGHAGTKIGWALIEDRSLYLKALEHIETTTGGVSRDSQYRARVILENQYDRLQDRSHPRSCFEYGRDVLEERWRSIRAIAAPRIKVLNNGGMFLWVELEGSQDAASEVLSLYSIKGRDGRACGGGANQVRFNVGCSPHDFQQFIERLK